VDYLVNFRSTGTFTFWVHGTGEHGGNDSCWGGVDGAVIGVHFWPSDMNDLTWVSNPVAVDTLGLHTVSIWGREDGFELDKVALANP
jgi:hypothetical protein